MEDFKKHLILQKTPMSEALFKLEALSTDAVLFIVDKNERLIGSLSDGDVRRGFLSGLDINSEVDAFIQNNPKYIKKGVIDINEIINFKTNKYKIIPVVDSDRRIIKIINFRFFQSYLPLDVIIMAGGRGQRLSPLTDKTPKPLLRVGDKSIIELNIDRLVSFGVEKFWICINYLGDQIIDHLGNGDKKNVDISYIKEDKPLGTLGSISKINKHLLHEYTLITNSDLLTNIDYEDFFKEFLEQGADVSVAAIPYSITVPYAILDTKDSTVTSLKEKPTFTFYANAGIYLVRSKLLKLVPEDCFFNATDFIETCLQGQFKVNYYSVTGYWLDIGNPDDYQKAQQDIQHINF